MRRICKYCEREYDGDPGGSCCPDCAAAQRKTTIRDRVCRQCGCTFPGGPRAWYCPACRRERKAEQSREYHKRGAIRPIGSLDRCAVCGKPYEVTGSRQRYCPACASDAVREIDRAQSRTWSDQNITPASRRAERRKASAEIPCAVCGTMFVPHDASLTCSPTCSAELRRRTTRTWEADHREERNLSRKARRKAAENRMTPEEYQSYRAEINARARANYRKRKGL